VLHTTIHTVVGAIAIAEVHVLGVGGVCEPSGTICSLGILAEVAIFLPDNSAVKGSLGQLLVVIGMVQVLSSAFSIRDSVKEI